jgi:hypothetical protein
MPILAGVPVCSDLVRDLAARVDEPTSSELLRAVDADRVVIDLAIDDGERILRVLDDCPPWLAELRGVLLGEHGRAREGL